MARSENFLTETAPNYRRAIQHSKHERICEMQVMVSSVFIRQARLLPVHLRIQVQRWPPCRMRTPIGR